MGADQGHDVIVRPARLRSVPASQGWAGYYQYHGVPGNSTQLRILVVALVGCGGAFESVTGMVRPDGYVRFIANDDSLSGVQAYLEYLVAP
jgi:hypothetical protein